MEFWVFWFVCFLRKRKNNEKKVRRLKEKKHTVILGQWGHAPTDLSCLAPKAALTLPAPPGGPLG